MKHHISTRNIILPISLCALLSIILCIFFLPPAKPSVPAESYDITSMPNSQTLTEEEKQEKYQSFLKDKLTEEIQAFCGENITIEPTLNDKKEVTEITLVLNSSNKLEDDIALQIQQFISNAYELNSDNVNFSYR